MIPTIGLMIGGYIVFRCIELYARPASAYSSPKAHTYVRVFAVLGVLATLLFCCDLIISGGMLEPKQQASVTHTPTEDEIREMQLRTLEKEGLR